MRLPNRMFATALCISVLLCGAIVPAQAKEDVCKADAEKFCKGVEPGEGRILKCLNQHEAELSPACRETVSAWMQRVSEGGEAVLPACKQDAARLCQGVAPGQGRIATCLKQHEAELSQECKDAVSAKVQKAKESAETLDAACRPFVEQFCKEVQPGHGRIAVCLKAHASELSQECRELVSAEIRKVQPAAETVTPSCKKDAARLCQGIPAGQGRLAVCLKEHEAELSQECKQAVAAKVQKAKESAEAVDSTCRQFLDQFCKDVTPGQGRTAVCLKAHASELSPECKQAVAAEIKKVKATMETVLPPCRKDAGRLCHDVPAGQGRLAVCLKAHASELSSECREALGAKPQSEQPSAGAGGEDQSILEQDQSVGVEAQTDQEKEAQPTGEGVPQRKPGKAEKKRQKAEQKIERTRQKAERKIQKTQEKAGIESEAPVETTGER